MKQFLNLKKIFLASLIGVFFVGSAWADSKNHEMGFYVTPGIYTATPLHYIKKDGKKVAAVIAEDLLYYAVKGATRGGTMSNPSASLFNTAGGLYYTYAPKGGFGYRLDLSLMAFLPATIKNPLTGETKLYGGGAFAQLDNVFFWDLIPKEVDFIKFDLGFALRLFLGGTLFQPTLYYDVDANIPDTGIHFNFTGNIGTLDIHNSDVKTSVAFEFGSNVLWGLELGYKYFGYSHFSFDYIYQKKLGMHTGFVAMYLKM